MHTQRRRGATRRLRRTQRTPGDRRAPARRRKENMVDRSWKPKVVFPTQIRKGLRKGTRRENSLRYFAKYLASFELIKRSPDALPQGRATAPQPLEFSTVPLLTAGERKKKGLLITQEASDYGITHFDFKTN